MIQTIFLRFHCDERNDEITNRINEILKDFEIKPDNLIDIKLSSYVGKISVYEDYNGEEEPMQFTDILIIFKSNKKIEIETVFMESK